MFKSNDILRKQTALKVSYSSIVDLLNLFDLMMSENNFGPFFLIITYLWILMEEVEVLLTETCNPFFLNVLRLMVLRGESYGGAIIDLFGIFLHLCAELFSH